MVRLVLLFDFALNQSIDCWSYSQIAGYIPIISSHIAIISPCYIPIIVYHTPDLSSDIDMNGTNGTVKYLA